MRSPGSRARRLHACLGSSTARDPLTARAYRCQRCCLPPFSTASAPRTSLISRLHSPAYAYPYRRFAAALADDDARLGAGVDRYSFTVMDLHHLLLAGLPAHSALPLLCVAFQYYYGGP